MPTIYVITADSLLKGEKPLLKDLTNAVVPETSSEWHALGLQLNITKARLDAIQTDYPRDCRRCCTEMLSECLSQDDGASWPTLIAALGSRALGQTELAGCLEEYIPHECFLLELVCISFSYVLYVAVLFQVSNICNVFLCVCAYIPFASNLL